MRDINDLIVKKEVITNRDGSKGCTTCILKDVSLEELKKIGKNIDYPYTTEIIIPQSNKRSEI